MRFQFKVQLNNVPQASTGFSITSNLGEVQADASSLPNQGKYGVFTGFRLPAGSADISPQVFLTMKDMIDTSIVKQWIFDNPCYTVSAADFSKNTIFNIAPNPVPEHQALRILLENDFFGTLKFEFLSVDGRILKTFEQEKTTGRQVFEIGDLPAPTQFFVRVSDGKTSMSRLVFKPE